MKSPPLALPAAHSLLRPTLITVLLEKDQQAEEKSVVDSNVTVAEQLATVSAPGAAHVSAPDAALKRDRGVIKQNLGAVPLKRDVDGSLYLHSFTESFQLYAQSVDRRLRAVLEGFRLSPLTTLTVCW